MFQVFIASALGSAISKLRTSPSKNDCRSEQRRTQVQRLNHCSRILFTVLLCSSLAALFGGGVAAAQSPAVSTVYCSTGSLLGAATDICTVKLASSSTSATSVSLASNNTAVTIPSAVTVPANQAAAQFTATIASVGTTQTVTLTATSGGVSKTVALQLNAATRTLKTSVASLAFQDVAVNASMTQPVVVTSTGSLPVTISSAAVSGAGYSVSGATFPLTLNPNQTVTLSVLFHPAVAGTVAGQLTLNGNVTSGSPAVTLSGTGGVPPMSAFYCNTATLLGAETDLCTVKIGAISASSGTVVSLTSSNPSVVSIPSSVTVAENATAATFTANAASVGTAQTVTLTASSGGVSETFAMQLGAATRIIKVSSANLAFQEVALNSSMTQSVVVTSAGSLPVTISAASLTGTGYSVSGATFPLTLNPNQSITLSLQFHPTVAGAASGQLNFTSNATTSASVSLNGTGGVPALSAFYCNTATALGAVTDICTVKLGSTSASATTVALSSSAAAVTVPASVSVPANTSAAQFTANIASVGTAQTVTLTAASGSSSMPAVLQLGAATRTLKLSATNLAYQEVALNGSVTQAVTVTSSGSLPVTISSASLTGTGYSTSTGIFPLTLSPGQTVTLSVLFHPTVAGVAAGQLTLNGNLTSGSAAVTLSGSGGVPAVSSFYCSTATALGAATDICTVKIGSLSASGTVVSLASSGTAVTVPSSVTVPANTTAVQFTAAIASVPTSQTVTLTATTGSAPLSYPLQLTGAVSKLNVSTTSLNFLDVLLNASASQGITLSSTGTEPVVISSAAASGSGFSVSGATFPLTLKPGQTATLSINFSPTAAGAVTGQVAISSNASSTPALISVSGTGGAPALSTFYCATATITGAVTDTCTVKLTSTSASVASPVTLASSNSTLVTLPSSVSIPANSTATQFSVNVPQVSTAQSVVLTASAGGVTQTVTLQLGAVIKTLSVNRTGMVFANVVVNASSTQSMTLSSTGTVPLTISSVSLSGTGFSMPGAAFPLTLNPGQSALLSVMYHPTAVGATAGQLVINSNSSAGAAVVTLNGLAVNGANTANSAGSFDYTGAALVNTLIPTNPWAAISGDFFGQTIVSLAPNSNYSEPNMTPFPSFPVSTLRLFDVSYWAMIQAYPGENNFSKLDNTISIAQQNGVSDFLFDFGRPPVWASTNPTDPCPTGEGPGTCSPPIMADYDAFVTQIVQRYCGTIKYYEPWNEPDNPQFWDGDNSQMLTIVQHVYQIAKDPANCGCANGVCSPGGGTNPNQVVLPPISNTTATGIAWLNSFLSDAGSFSYADIAGFHGYGYAGTPENLTKGISALKQTLATYNMSNLPLWDTEGSWEWNALYDEQQQASWLMRYHVVQIALNVSRATWYSYDQCAWGTLYNSALCGAFQQGPSGTLTPAGSAYGVMENWLIGANLTQCLQFQNGLWACELQRSGGYDAWMLWSSTGSATGITVPIPSSMNMTVYRDWQNNVNSLPSQITVTQMPVLLENTDTQ